MSPAAGRPDDGDRRPEDERPDGERPDDAAPSVPGDLPDQGTPGDAPLTEADVERMLAALGAAAEVPGPDATQVGGTEAGGAPDEAGAPAAHQRPGAIALVLTPVASAPALAGLCAMSGIDVDVVPSTSGAVAVLELAPKQATDEWDISELVGEGGGPSLPPEAEELATTLSRLARAGVVLLAAELATDVGIEAGLSGHIHARQYTGGEPEGDMPAGLVLANADQVVEDLLLGRVRPQDVKGHQRSGTLPRWKAARMFARGLRRRKP
ncbi:hypothetical protein [Georgenia ruanii]|uniref:hypothetical protein n=1 Tax=Georgenia ruanii TaxID=348442 RepID=UPI001263FF0E|nr:hypothetical protein [Georgenia ruanii]